MKSHFAVWSPVSLKIPIYLSIRREMTSVPIVKREHKVPGWQCNALVLEHEIREAV